MKNLTKWGVVLLLCVTTMNTTAQQKKKVVKKKDSLVAEVNFSSLKAKKKLTDLTKYDKTTEKKVVKKEHVTDKDLFKKKYMKKASEISNTKFKFSGVNNGFVYKNKVVWGSVDFNSKNLDTYIFISNKDFSKVNYFKLTNEMKKWSLKKTADHFIK